MKHPSTPPPLQAPANARPKKFSRLRVPAEVESARDLHSEDACPERRRAKAARRILRPADGGHPVA